MSFSRGDKLILPYEQPTGCATSFPGSFVFPEEGVVDLRPLPLVGRRKTLGTRLLAVFHKRLRKMKPLLLNSEEYGQTI